MQRGLVDMVIVGTDRTTRRGDVCNKIGTYLKALAARDNAVPFYVALPSPRSTGRWKTDSPRSDRGARAPRDHPCPGAHGSGRDRARPGRAGGRRGRKPRLRRDPEPPRHRPHHRARGLRRERRGPRRPVPGAGRRGREDRVARGPPPHEYTGRTGADRALAPGLRARTRARAKAKAGQSMTSRSLRRRKRCDWSRGDACVAPAFMDP